MLPAQFWNPMAAAHSADDGEYLIAHGAFVAYYEVYAHGR